MPSNLNTEAIATTITTNGNHPGHTMPVATTDIIALQYSLGDVRPNDSGVSINIGSYLNARNLQPSHVFAPVGRSFRALVIGILGLTGEQGVKSDSLPELAIASVQQGERSLIANALATRIKRVSASEPGKPILVVGDAELVVESLAHIRTGKVPPFHAYRMTFDNERGCVVGSPMPLGDLSIHSPVSPVSM